MKNAGLFFTAFLFGAAAVPLAFVSPTRENAAAALTAFTPTPVSTAATLPCTAKSTNGEKPPPFDAFFSKLKGFIKCARVSSARCYRK